MISKENKNNNPSTVVPTGLLKYLATSDIKPNQNNPRQLFDPEPLKELKASIRDHGVLVPITVYKIKAQDKYAILDGERRYRCCLELESEGVDRIDIPANIVEPPSKIAGLLYMFSIHNFREQWDLMPTALSLKTVMGALNEEDNKKLSKLTGLSENQIERCKILLSFDSKFQSMSLMSDPKKRVPSNFWIEAYPVIKIYEKKLPELIQEMGRDALIRVLANKYINGKIGSVIHFRRIREASEKSSEDGREKEFIKRLREYIKDEDLEIRESFDNFLPTRQIRTVTGACSDFIEKIKKMELGFATEDRSDLIKNLSEVKSFLDDLIERISGEDAPKDINE